MDGDDAIVIILDGFAADCKLQISNIFILIPYLTFVWDQLRLRNHFCYVLITNGCFWITLGLCNRKIIIVYRDKSQSRICLFSTILD